ncbi:hypothetical protein [Croceivirga thetidis]|uniref:O-antigen ligase domain-containing protein n=1 Tax=Croceivirga thetidis TaxID=2721623 RepID=A0ABX1GQ53_9FLAO|nr:hypothetical protein [Croceivirga thetidis]NKI32042.1 hypothetical protein [Croceivirga thetidis]
MRKILSLLAIIFVMAGSIRFFEPAFVEDSILNYLQYLSVLVAVTLSLPHMIKPPFGFNFPVYLLLIAVIFSIFMAVIFWDQGIKDSLLATFEYFIIFFYFFLVSSTISLQTLERIIIGFGIVYILLYAFQFVSGSTIYFGKSLWGDEFIESRGVVRIIFPAGGILYLSTFLAFTKSLTAKGLKKWLWILFSMFGILAPILQVTRQFIAGVILILILHIIISLSPVKKTFLALMFLLAGLLILNTDLPLVKGLQEQTTDDLGQGKDYIRVQAGKYFLTEFSPNTTTGIFGNGVAYSGVSNYGSFVDMLQYTQEYFLSDLGIITVYVQFGVLAILSFIVIWILSITVPLDANYYYLKYYLWLLLITSLTWYSVYHHHYLFCNVLVLAMYQRASKNFKEEKINGKLVLDETK